MEDSVRRSRGWRRRTCGPRPDSAPVRQGGAGQGLVEFALVFPIFVVMLMGVIEFGFAFSSLLVVNFASRDAALLGAEAGKTSLYSADCVILNSIEHEVGAPSSPAHITEVDIFDSNAQGLPIDPASGTVNTALVSRWLRTGSTTCTFQGKTLTVFYTLQSPPGGYPEEGRCNVQHAAGCSPRYNHSLDTIGVSITYSYHLVTPLGNFVLGLGGGGSNPTWTFVQTNEMRMEPVL